VRIMVASLARGGIEAVMLARRNELPTREMLQERLVGLTAHLTSRESTPGEVFADQQQLHRSHRPQSAAGQQTLEQLESALAAVEEDSASGSEETTPPQEELTAKQLAAAVRANLGLDTAPLMETVAQAMDMLSIEPVGTLIENLRECHARVAASRAGTPRSADRHDREARSTSSQSFSGDASGSLLHGAYDEAASSTSFADAVASWRGTRDRPKGPPLGERLLSKGLVRGCTMDRDG